MGFEKVIKALNPKKTKTVVMSYRTSPEIRDFFRNYAKQEGTTMQSIFNEALTMYLTEKRDELKKGIDENDKKEGAKV